LANRAVKIYEEKLVDGKQRYEPVEVPENRRPNGSLYLKDSWQGNFYLSWYEGPKKRWKKVPNSGKTSRGEKVFPTLHAAVAARDAKIWELQHPDRVKPEVPTEATRLNIAAGIFAYLEGHPNALDDAFRGKDSTKKEVRHALKEFEKYTRSTYVDEMTWKELDRWKVDLQQAGNDEVTAVWKLIRVNAFWKWAMNKKPGEGLFKTTIFKSVIQKRPVIEVYTPDEIKKFFVACNAAQFVIFQCYYKTGLRNKELAHLEWTDLDLDRRIINIRSKKMKDGAKKKDWGPKRGSEGDVIIPIDVLDALKKMRAESKCNLVFPTKNGRVNTKLLDQCKLVAKKAGLDWKKFKIKSFRSTYATNRLRVSQGDLPTVRNSLRHKDMKSIEHYIDYVKNEQLIASGKADQGWDA
jgi:integrase